MRVVHIATSTSGGAGIGMRRYHQALLRSGIDSRIVARDTSLLDRDDIALVKPHLSRHQRVGARLGIGNAAKFHRQLRHLNDRMDDTAWYELFSSPYSFCSPDQNNWVQAADIVNLHWVAGILDWPRFFKSVKKPIVLTLHDQQSYLGGFHYERDVKKNFRFSKLENSIQATKKAALSNHKIAVVANSQWNATRAMSSEFFAPSVHMETVYYPLDTSIFKPISKASAKETFGIKQDRKVVGFACEDLSNRRKGFSDLLEALTLLPKSYLDRITLLSFGKYPTAPLRETIKSSWVHLGSLDSETAQAAAYSAMDVFVIPSRAEAFGQTALEAIACGAQVIGSDAGGIPEALVNSPDSLLYPSGQVVELSKLLIQAIENHRNPKNRVNGHERVSQRHSFGECAKSHMNLYKRLINS